MKLSVHCRATVVTPVILLTVTLTILGASAAQQPASMPVVLRAEPGDTYFNLFGADWQKAFRQNRITVIREGRAIVSPDILVEGQILQVTSDTLLTDRALKRVRGLVERRATLQRLLSTAISRGGEARAKASELNQALVDDLRCVADLDYLEREAARLTSTTPPTPASQRAPWILVALAILFASIVLGGLVLRRHRSQGPTGDERMRAALRELRSIV